MAERYPVLVRRVEKEKRPDYLRLVRPHDGQWQRVFDDFMDAKKAKNLSPASLDFYRTVVARFASYESDWPPNYGGLQSFMLYLYGQNLSGHTVATYFRGLRSFFNWCLARGHLERNPIDGLERPIEPQADPRAIPVEELTRVFEFLKECSDTGDILATRNHALFRMIYDCALRVTAAARLKVSDLDLERQAVWVTKAKRGKSREVYYGQKTDRALARWLRVLVTGSPWLWTSADTSRGLQPLTRQGVTLAWRRCCHRAGIGHYRVHDLRHSYARHALRRGIDYEMVSRQLGHSSPAFTLKLYGKSEDEDRRLVHQEKAPGDAV